MHECIKIEIHLIHADLAQALFVLLTKVGLRVYELTEAFFIELIHRSET
jgi:hypothetical protein